MPRSSDAKDEVGLARTRRCAARTTAARRHRPGFTLIELLAVVGVIALLIGLLSTALGSAMRSSRSFKCVMSLRSVAFDFQIFADDSVHGDRGNDTLELSEGQFRLQTFQESQYGIDEFWRYGATATTASLPTPEGDNPMRCAEVRGPLLVRRNEECYNTGSLEPPGSVSYAFNMRLAHAEVERNRLVQWTQEIALTSAIRGHGDVPLVFDVDGTRAATLGHSPTLSAPSLDSRGPYAGDAYWYPAYRHAGSLNVAFIDGRVETTRAPLEERGWRWDYQPTD